jgi:hypothetical protein
MLTKDITINITGITFQCMANSREYVKMFTDESKRVDQI